MILDEAQNIKNPSAQQTQAIRRLPAGFRIALTGTPVENRLSELWSIMQFLNPGYLGSHEQFPAQLCRADRALRRRRGRRTAAGTDRARSSCAGSRPIPRVIQDLPEKLEMKVYCNLTEEQATLYEAVVQEAMTEVEQAEGIDRRGQVLAMLMKLKQVCNHPAHFLHQAGSTAACRSMSSRPAQRQAGPAGRDAGGGIVGRRPGAGLHPVRRDGPHAAQLSARRRWARPALFLHGGTPAAQRDQMVARFQSEDGPPVFILSLKAGGTGLNLTHANHVFHFDRWWNPAVEDQATDRAFRIGQTRNVQVHKFVSLGTLEEMIDDLIESKRALARAIVGSGENWLTELSTGELRALVTLRRDAVAE